MTKSSSRDCINQYAASGDAINCRRWFQTETYMLVTSLLSIWWRSTPGNKTDPSLTWNLPEMEIKNVSCHSLQLCLSKLCFAVILDWHLHTK